MFELLLIIYLLPVLIIGMLLLKLVFWLLRISIRLAVWLVKKTGKNRTNMINGTVLIKISRILPLC